MKLRGQIVSYYEPDILREIERFEAEERERVILLKQEAERRRQEKANAAEVRWALARMRAATPPEEIAWSNAFIEARREHVFLLKCEGLTLGQISERIGVSRERVRQMLRKASCRVQRAMMSKWPRGRTRFYFEVSQ